MSDFFHTNGIRSVNVGYRKEDLELIKQDWKEFVNDLPPYPGGYEGAGIVICAGGIQYFTCCWILVNMLRKELGCTLPVQVWYNGEELTSGTIALLNQLDVSCHNFQTYEKELELHGWMLKPLAILLSSFKEVLFLDADNIPVRNPDFLFQTAEYKKYGAVFWPDFWSTDLNNQIWKIIERTPVLMKEQESGQLLINKEKCWRELNLALYFNRTHYIYYNLLLGDKDTFRFAWMALHTPFYFVLHEVATCGYEVAGHGFSGHTMVQYTPDGEFCFLHRNLLKWNVEDTERLSWKKIKRFIKNPAHTQYTIYFCDGHISMNLDGDIEELDFVSSLGTIEEKCLGFLRELKEMNVYQDFVNTLSTH